MVSTPLAPLILRPKTAQASKRCGMCPHRLGGLCVQVHAWRCSFQWSHSAIPPGTYYSFGDRVWLKLALDRIRVNQIWKVLALWLDMSSVSGSLMRFCWVVHPVVSWPTSGKKIPQPCWSCPQQDPRGSGHPPYGFLAFQFKMEPKKENSFCFCKGSLQP